MLRIHVEHDNGAVKIRLEGKLIHPWVDELFLVWMDTVHGLAKGRLLLVDLNAVSFVDARGKAMLAAMCRTGGRLQGSGPFIAAVIEEINAILND